MESNCADLLTATGDSESYILELHSNVSSIAADH